MADWLIKLMDINSHDCVIIADRTTQRRAS